MEPIEENLFRGNSPKTGWQRVFGGQVIAQAMVAATFLSRFAEKVTLIHRRDELRASKIMQDRAFADPKIEFAWNSAVEAIHGDDKLTGLTLVDTVTGEQRHLDATGLFIAVGHDPRSELLHGQVQDPFGHRWNISQHVRDVPHDEVVAAAAQLFA